MEFDPTGDAMIFDDEVGYFDPPPPEIPSAPYSKGTVRESNPGRAMLLNPVSWAALQGSEDVDWLWKGYVARVHITLLLGLWKAGKSTLLAHLLAAFAEGGELGTPVRAAKVLVISEESGLLWKQRRETLKVEGAHVDFVCRPFKGRPSWDQWSCIVGEMVQLVRQRGYALVIIDTLGGSWPVWKENDSGQVQGALMPLHGITELGAAILLVHHSKKGDATEGQASRGSGALPAFADVIMEFRRLNPEEWKDRRRVLTAYSRFDQTPHELVIELQSSGYIACGTKSDANHNDRMCAAVRILGDAGKALTVDDLLAEWNGTIPKPRRRTLEVDLSKAIEEDSVTRTGNGKKGSPYRYSIRARSGSYIHETQNDHTNDTANSG